MELRKQIINDEPFQVNKRAFVVGPSATGYTLKHNPAYVAGSAINEADWQVYDPDGGNGQIASGKSLVVLEGASGNYYRLVGNVGNVYYR